MTLDLVPLWASILALAVFMYVLLDGFDLGVGIIFLLKKDHAERDLMVDSIAPIWDFNETWLILGIGGLLAVFPLAFAILLPAVYFPILLMLLGLLLRGVAFEFRALTNQRKWLWDNAFGYGSLLATFAQGIVLGMFVHGVAVSGRQFAGTSWDWVTPFPLLTGIGLVFGYALQGSTWLVMKTEHALQQWARKVARISLIGVILFIVMMSLWTPLANDYIARRWFSLPNLLIFSPVPILTALLVWQLWTGLSQRREVSPFLCSFGLFFLAYTGLIISLWPYIVPPRITLWDAAASPSSQTFILLGTLFLLPIILFYVFWSYWVFRGKIKQHANTAHGFY